MRLFPAISNPRRGHDASAHRGNAAMEPLESRQMLSATLQPASTAGDAHPALAAVAASFHVRSAAQLDGTYTGTLRITGDDTGILGRTTRRVRLDIAQQDGGFKVAGIMTIDGVGTFDVTGTVRRRKVTLLIGASDDISNLGRIDARLRKNGRVLRGTLVEQVGNRSIEGNLRLVRTGATTMSLARTGLDRGVLASTDRGVLPNSDDGVLGDHLGVGNVLVDEFGNPITFSTRFSAGFLNGFFAMFGSFGSGFNTFGSGTGVGTLASSGSVFASFGSGTGVGSINGTTFNGGFNTFGSGTGVGSTFSISMMT